MRAHVAGLTCLDTCVGVRWYGAIFVLAGYAKKEYYYAKGIHCDALNPNSGSTCVENEYGAQVCRCCTGCCPARLLVTHWGGSYQLIGDWYVESMFGNQCFFVVGQTGR